MKFSPNEPCPCGSGNKYKHCCQRFHKGKPAPTPEAVMRARYSAYAIGIADYILKTTHPDSRYHQSNRDQWRREMQQYSQTTTFAQLDILEVSDIEADKGYVTFKATIFQGTKDLSFQERSLFQKHHGQWKYVRGDFG